MTVTKLVEYTVVRLELTQAEEASTPLAALPKLNGAEPDAWGTGLTVIVKADETGIVLL